jgi:hypothetical protein
MIIPLDLGCYVWKLCFLNFSPNSSSSYDQDLHYCISAMQIGLDFCNFRVVDIVHNKR